MALLIYIVKVNLILALLCLLFQMLMRRDTFFGIRRGMLLGIYVLALLLPLWNMQGWMASQAGTTEMTEAYASYVLPALDVTAERVAFLGVHQTEPGCGMWVVGFMFLWGVIYLVPVAWLLAKLLWQVGYILYLRFTCDPATLPLSKNEVFYYPHLCSPFSFGPWIFIHTDDMDTQMLHEVLIHEQAHVRGWHTLDVFVAHLFCIAFWWNPVVWMLRREVRMNLEFIADAAVCADNNVKAYQYHLLGFVAQKNVATLTNNFNVLPLKRRIVMMNATRTRRSGMLKYICFVLVAAVMLLLSNVDTMARAQGNPLGTNSEQYAGDDKIYDIVEVNPEYIGGVEAMYMAILKTMKYPVKAQEAGVDGRVMVQFVVEKDGSLSDVKAIRVKSEAKQLSEVVVTAKKDNVTPEEKAAEEAREAALQSLKDEAVRVVKSLPNKWNPATQDGKPVRSRFLLPVVFRLR